MQIYLVRHTTPDIWHDTCYGRQDIGLAATFEQEASVVLDKLLRDQSPTPPSAQPSLNISNVFCSPLQRCRRLATALTALAATVDDRLMEIDFGSWEMRRWDDIPPVEMTAWERNPLQFAPPNGETATEVATRSQSFVDDVLKLSPDATVLVVTHGGPIHMIVAALLQVPLFVALRFHVDYASVSRIEVRTDQTKLTLLNR